VEDRAFHEVVDLKRVYRPPGAGFEEPKTLPYGAVREKSGPTRRLDTGGIRKFQPFLELGKRLN
jgi:hypothetical protein